MIFFLILVKREKNSGKFTDFALSRTREESPVEGSLTALVPAAPHIVTGLDGVYTPQIRELDARDFEVCLT